MVTEQDRMIEKLTARIAELERRVGQSSRNSSRPPSSDGPDAPRRTARRGTSRRPSKQPGSPGSTLALVDDPDEIIEHLPDCCRGCGADLADAKPVGVVGRQVHDIPVLRPVTTEHRLHRRRCGCGEVTSSRLLPGWPGGCSTGPSLRALAVCLLVFQPVPVARTAQLIDDLTGAHPSTGWVSAALAEAATTLVDVERLIKTLITLAHVIHVDETSSGIAGNRWWLHAGSTTAFTCYHLHRSRVRVAVARERCAIPPTWCSQTCRAKRADSGSGAWRSEAP